MGKSEVGLFILYSGAMLVVLAPLTLGILVSQICNRRLRMALTVLLLFSQMFVNIFVIKNIYTSYLAGNPWWDLCAQSFDVLLKQQHQILRLGRDDLLKEHIESAYELRTNLMKGLEKDKKAFCFFEKWENLINNTN